MKKNVSNREFWDVCYQEWALNDFKQQLWIQKKTFGLILKIIRTFLEKKATNSNSNPMTLGQQLGLPNISNRPWYSLHNPVADTWSINAGSKWNHELYMSSHGFCSVKRLCKTFWYRRSLKSWTEKFYQKLRVPLNWCSKLGSNISFKKPYSMSNLGYTKRFLYDAVGAPIRHPMQECREARNSSCYYRRSYIP